MWSSRAHECRNSPSLEFSINGARVPEVPERPSRAVYYQPTAKMSGGECQTGNTKDYEGEEDEAPTQALDDADIELLKSYGRGPYTDAIKTTEDEIKKHQDKVR